MYTYIYIYVYMYIYIYIYIYTFYMYGPSSARTPSAPAALPQRCIDTV